MYFHSQKFDKSYSEECCHQINLFNFFVTLPHLVQLKVSKRYGSTQNLSSIDNPVLKLQ